MIVNRAQLADLFGVDAGTLTSWADSGMPTVRGGKAWRADSAACIRWHVERERQRGGADDAVSRQRARLLGLQADARERDNGLAGGSLLRREDVQAAVQVVAAQTQAALFGLVRLVTPIRAAATDGEAVLLLRTEVHRALVAVAAMARDGWPDATTK